MALRCWGGNVWGEQGDCTVVDKITPAPVVFTPCGATIVTLNSIASTHATIGSVIAGSPFGTTAPGPLAGSVNSGVLGYLSTSEQIELVPGQVGHYSHDQLTFYKIGSTCNPGATASVTQTVTVNGVAAAPLQRTVTISPIASGGTDLLAPAATAAILLPGVGTVSVTTPAVNQPAESCGNGFAGTLFITLPTVSDILLTPLVPGAPTAHKAFNPTTITSGGTSTLSVTLSNPNTTALTGVGFTDNLPAGMTIAATPALANSCGGTPTATAGSSVFSLANGTIPASGSCVISANVTATAATTTVLNNSTGVIASSAGAGAAASADLTVTAVAGPVLTPPTAQKAFSPTTITSGGTSTLSITLTNPNATALTGVGFTDNLPAGMRIAATPALVNGCGGTPSATAGGSVFSLASGTIPANGSCVISVNVTGTALATIVLSNSTGPISSSAGAGAAATAGLTVNPVTSPTVPPGVGCGGVGPKGCGP